MVIDTKQIVSMTEANQNFSRIARLIDEYEKVVIMKNNKPKYVVFDLEKKQPLDLTEDEEFLIISRRVLHEHIEAFKELAK